MFIATLNLVVFLTPAYTFNQREVDLSQGDQTIMSFKRFL